ncbi:MAG TPA: serine/threonine-protein kinase [Gemmatimonadaceae bacterium]|nr:serine/threonine-protein kinase [Gemmatimonadaceae bacterium]
MACPRTASRVLNARMDSARWTRVQALFHDTADLPEAERDAFLKARCSDDPSLMAEVLSLVVEDARTGSLLDRGIGHAAHHVLGGDDEPAIPTENFGPYRIAKILGEGGMGVVYLAERSDLGSVAAIKILRDAWLSPARRERFSSEQRVLAQLNHAFIARLYDADTLADGTPWFVMEYVEGQTLTAYCDARALPISARLKLFRDVCEAVAHAHQHAIIHRDLKPSNILVRKDGTVKLLDFGISKQLETLDVSADQTQTGLRFMTPAYAAPEQVRGEPVGMRTDIYALGVVLYELVAGKLPFDLSNKTPAEAATIIVEHSPGKPSAAASAAAARPGDRVRAGGVSKAAWADLDVLCLTAMHKDPERRYRTVDALIRDVDHYLNGEPLEARPDSVRYRVSKFVRRNWRLVSGAAAALALLIALSAMYTVRLAAARNTALAESARTARIQRFTMSLFDGGNKEAGPADTLRVVTLVDRGVQQARTLDAEPAVQAELYETLGSIYQKLGNFPRADTLLRASLDERRSLFKPGSPEVTGSLSALGLLRADQAKLDESETLIREALGQARRTLPPDHPALARATFALGRVLQERGKYDDAIKVGEETVRLYSVPGGVATPELAASLSQLAVDHFNRGHYETSDSLNQLALAAYRRLYGERHPLVASTLLALGDSQTDLGHYAVAERYGRQALQILNAFYGVDHFQTAVALDVLGRALVYERKVDEGMATLSRALALRERALGPFHPQVATSRNELGNAAFQQNRFADAESLFTRNVEIYRKVYGDKHQFTATGLANLASVYMAQKQPDRAEPIFRDVIRIQTDAVGADHPNTAIARIKLGRALLRQKRYADGASETLAGYEILSKKSDPMTSFLDAARKDLAADYDSLKQPEKAARFRKELADLASKTGVVAKKP